MASVNKATILSQLQEAATRIKQYVLQQISDLSDAVLEAIPETYAGSSEAGGVANKAAAIPYGHVDSTSTATAYTATIDGITELVDGTTVLLKNGVITSQSGFTVDINGLGAKPVYNSMAAASAETTIFNVNYTLLLVYDSTRVSGGCWINYRGYYTDANTVPTGYCTTAAGTAAKVATCTYGYRDDDNYFPCLFRYENTAANATLAIASYATTAAPIYVNGARTSASNTFGRGVIMFLYHNGAYYTYNDGRFPIVVDGTVTSVQEYVATKYTKPSGGIPASDLAAGAIPTVPSAATSAPLMDGTAAVGSSTKWAKEDHVHPTDTSRQEKLVSGTNIKTINGNSLLGSGDLTIGGGASLPAVSSSDNDKVLMVVDGTWAASALPVYNGEIVTPAYNVTVSLTNPVNASGFSRAYICALDDQGEAGEVIGRFQSPSESITVSIDGFYGFDLTLDGLSVSVDLSNISCAGGASFSGESTIGSYQFQVTGNGTVTIDQVDYDD